MKPLPPFVGFVLEQFSILGDATARFMMGGYVVYVDSIVCALVADGAVFLKGDQHNIPDFEARGLKAFKPFPDQDLVMKYFEAPPEIFEDPDALRKWVGGALQAGQRSAKKKPAGKRVAKKAAAAKKATKKK
jgi:DNA transformation protein